MQNDWIEDTDTLQQWIKSNQNVDWIGLDTEFIFRHTYYPRWCLLQIAVPEQAVILDVPKLNLDPLAHWLLDQNKLKIVHAGYQDINMLYRLWQQPIQPLFDTQIAAQLIGHGHQIGYAQLVKKILGIQLHKKYTLIDWRKRPLSDEQKRYALDDVIYLAPLQKKLAPHLDQAMQNRLKLKQKRYFKPDMDPKKAWLKVKNRQRLKKRDLAVLKSLAEWREIEAQHRNKHRRYILSDEILCELARIRPKNIYQMASLKSISYGIIRHHGPALLNRINRALDELDQKN